MNYFLTKIKVNKLLHLQDFEIPLDENVKKHLVITGRNGSGKTILINAILDYLEFGEIREIKLFFNNIQFKNNDLIIAFYEAERQLKITEVKSPVKPDLKPAKELKQKKVDQFLHFLVDCKIQEALARNEKEYDDADKIGDWFTSFTNLLKEIFEDNDLELIFNYQDYSFKISSQGKLFSFTELAAGYSAILDIVADLILKMQTANSLTRAYDKQGVVLIDEIETHLHLELQRLILPMLTRIFPNIQFIVTTHSPFILSSLPDIVAFDLEKRTSIEDLTAYSYESLAEGYFGVKTDSSDIQLRLQRLKELVDKKSLTASEEYEINGLIDDFDKIPEAIAPSVKAEFYQLKLVWNSKGNIQ